MNFTCAVNSFGTTIAPFFVTGVMFAGTKKKIGRIEGFSMVALYAIYAVYIIIR